MKTQRPYLNQAMIHTISNFLDVPDEINTLQQTVEKQFTSIREEMKSNTNTTRKSSQLESAEKKKIVDMQVTLLIL